MNISKAFTDTEAALLLVVLKAKTPVIRNYNIICVISGAKIGSKYDFVVPSITGQNETTNNITRQFITRQSIEALR